MPMASQPASPTQRLTLPPRPLPRVSLRDQAYEVMVQAIVDGGFPPGHQIRDLDIAEALGVSRTPVREALQRLIDEGLVQTAPGAATRVAPIDTASVRNIYPIVGSLHALAVRLGEKQIGLSQLDALARANTAFTEAVSEHHIADALAADDAFHGVFLDAAANPELRRTLDRLMPHVRRLRLTQFSSEAARRSIRQHTDIIQAWSNASSPMLHG